MTISLPISLSHFRQEFNAVCERIRHTKQDPIFFSLLTALVANFEQHPLFQKLTQEWSVQSLNKKKADSLLALELCEQAWTSLWHDLRAKWRQHRMLAHIKRLVYSPKSSLIPLHVQLMADMEKVATSLHLFIANPFHNPALQDHHKREQMQRFAALDLSFCWARLCFLQLLGDLCSDAPTQPPQCGEWTQIRLQVWETACSAREQHMNLAARHSLASKFALPPRPSLDAVLPMEYRIDRAEYEGYLSSWQDHINTLLVPMEVEGRERINKKKEGKTQRAAFVIEITGKYWQEHPKAKSDDAYAHYCTHCPPDSKPLSDDQWKRVVKENKLDPRLKKEKVRGKGK